MVLSLKKGSVKQYIVHGEVLCLSECVWKELSIIRLIIEVFGSDSALFQSLNCS